MDFFKDFPVSYLDYLRISNNAITYNIDYEHAGVKKYDTVRVIPNNVVNTVKDYSCYRTVIDIVNIPCQCKKCDLVLYMFNR